MATLDFNSPYGTIMGEAPIEGARYTQGGLYFNAAGAEVTTHEIESVPVTARTQNGVVTGLEAGGSLLLSPSGASDVQGVDITLSDLLNSRRLSPAKNLTLPSPYSGVGAAMVHPSVEYAPDGWNGYPYWMAVTPYPNSDSQYENPCVLASIDGESWVTPPGVTNPLIAKPAPASSYNSDTHLLRNPLDSTQMVLLYRARNIAGDNRLYVITSRDGFKAFTDPVLIWTGTIAGSNDMASPSLWYNATSSKWEIIGHNADAANFPLRKITSDSLLSGWDTVPAALTFSAVSGRAWWHSQFRRLSSGLIVGLAQDNNGTVGNTGNLYLAYSTDGAAYSYVPLDLGGNWYKPGFVIRQDRSGEKFLDCYFSKLLNTTTQKVTIKFDAAEFVGTKNVGNALLAQASAGVPGPLWGDLFTRADSAVAIGTATTGGSYTVDSGVVGISSNRAYGVNTGSNNRCLTASLGNADHSAQIKVDTVGTQGWFIGRAVDASNYWRLGWNTGSTYRVQSIVSAGVGAVDQVVGQAPAAGDVIRFVAHGTRLRWYINDVFVFEVESTVHQAGQKVGFQSTGASLTYFDNLAAWKT